MRSRIINFFKHHPFCVNMLWLFAKISMQIWGVFVPVQKKTIIFSSFGGRKFDDSPKAIYEEICNRKEYDDCRLIWAFVNPDEYTIPRGEKIKIDTLEFFKALLYSRVWISNSGMDRGIGLKRRQNLRVETWHGTPLKKICGDQNFNSIGGKKKKDKIKKDCSIIRCAQSEYDREIFSRIFHADINSILLSDLPRNDALFQYSADDILRIRRNLNIPENKKVILYTPTYREYKDIELPISLDKWKKCLGDRYVLLIRMHYAVSSSLNIHNDEFIIDVSDYHCLNDLYIISDMMVSDYSSTYFDYSILERPMFCYAYDLEEYEKMRGLYLDLEQVLPCSIDKSEEEVINNILNMNRKSAEQKAKEFHQCFTPNAGNACKVVVDEITRRL